MCKNRHTDIIWLSAFSPKTRERFSHVYHGWVPRAFTGDSQLRKSPTVCRLLLLNSTKTTSFKEDSFRSWLQLQTEQIEATHNSENNQTIKMAPRLRGKKSQSNRVRCCSFASAAAVHSPLKLQLQRQPFWMVNAFSFPSKHFIQLTNKVLGLKVIIHDNFKIGLFIPLCWSY